MYWVSFNEDGDPGLGREHEAHKQDKFFPEDPKISNILNAILRHSTLLGCNLFSERMVQENTVFQGTVRNVRYMEGRACSQQVRDPPLSLLQKVFILTVMPTLYRGDIHRRLKDEVSDLQSHSPIFLHCSYVPKPKYFMSEKVYICGSVFAAGSLECQFH